MHCVQRYCPAQDLSMLRLQRCDKCKGRDAVLSFPRQAGAAQSNVTVVCPPGFDGTITGAILVSTLLMMCERAGMPEWERSALEYVNALTTAFFLAEMALCIRNRGLRGYWADAFNRFDADGNGSLSASELALVASSLGAEFSKNELVAIFALLDRDHSGDVSFEEFSQWWLGDKEVDYSLI